MFCEKSWMQRHDVCRLWKVHVCACALSNVDVLEVRITVHLGFRGVWDLCFRMVVIISQSEARAGARVIVHTNLVDL